MNLKIKEYKNSIDDVAKSKIISLVREENPDSILAKLSPDNIDSFIEILVRSNKLNLFTCELNNEVIGYATFANKPSFLVSEFYEIKYKIFLNLLVNFHFLTILNLIISILRVDIILLNKTNKQLLESNFNLNLLAIKKEYQSKGIGKLFLEEILKKIKAQNLILYITCETYDDRALDFYIKKCNFEKIGIKLRFFKNLHILCKRIN